jgi:L-seryl-tRNA(Ser) seleniumtransferase
MSTSNSLRSLPSVEQLLSSGSFDRQIEDLSRPLVTAVVRDVLQSVREQATAKTGVPSREEIVTMVENQLADLARRRITQVINGTGVLIHTNLGRAPLGKKLFERVAERVTGYCTLEFDLGTGKRGKRGSFLSYLLAQLTQAEAALAVNNNAAALYLILNSFANRKEVVVSRAELVQIGGGFRIPDIIRKAGAKLVEVGATNQTSERDYEEAINPKTAMLLKVHQSNFHLKGFVAEVSATEVAAIAAKRGIISVYDVGSGAYHQTENFGMETEPNITAALRSGSSLVCFSGDKLLGSVQAGIILGNAVHLNAMHKNPIYRVLRLDKLSIAMLEETAFAYLRKTDAELLPLWERISTPVVQLRKRAEKIQKALLETALKVEVRKSVATPGGGSLPGGTLESVALAIIPSERVSAFSRRLLDSSPPLIGYIEENQLLLDLRTIATEQDSDVVRILSEAAQCIP